VGEPRQAQAEQLINAINTHDFLRRILEEIERLQHVVFHGSPRADWSLARRTAEQILAAEILSRHHGNIDGIYFALRSHEVGGKSWAAAISELATNIHAYFTTPLGILMRRELFGEDAAFLTPEAWDWIKAQRPLTIAAGKGGE